MAVLLIKLLLKEWVYVMRTKEFLSYIVNEIHSVVIATVDGSGLPVTCAIDIMDCDENGLYFLTAKGKDFYCRLKSRGYVALTGMSGHDTLSSVAVSVRGKVRDIGPDRLSKLFEKNPYMYDIYPNETSQSALTVFQIYEGTGEWFDLSKKPVERADFSFGGVKGTVHGYFVTSLCTGCGLCYHSCPQKCIDIDTTPVSIRQENCLRCGNCFETCPHRAIEKR